MLISIKNLQDFHPDAEAPQSDSATDSNNGDSTESGTGNANATGTGTSSSSGNSEDTQKNTTGSPTLPARTRSTNNSDTGINGAAKDNHETPCYVPHDSNISQQKLTPSGN